MFGDSGYTGAGALEENKNRIVDWHIAAKPSAVRRLDPALQAQARYVETLWRTAAWKQAEKRSNPQDPEYRSKA